MLHIDPEVLTLIKKEYEDGKSVLQLSAKYCVPSGVLYRRLSKVTTRRRYTNPFLLRKWQQLDLNTIKT